MKACVVFLCRQARRVETVRRLAELRVALAEVNDIHPRYLAWDKIAIDRSSRRWRSLLALARLFLRRDWQATHRASDHRDPAGVTILFPMNELFEAYVAALLRMALTDEKAKELSLAENAMREAMHPADQFDAFAALAKRGMPVEDVAARFGVTPPVVRQRMKLASVSPNGLGKLGVGLLPFVDGVDVDAEAIGNIRIDSTFTTEGFDLRYEFGLIRGGASSFCDA